MGKDDNGNNMIRWELKKIKKGLENSRKKWKCNKIKMGEMIMELG